MLCVEEWREERGGWVEENEGSEWDVKDHEVQVEGKERKEVEVGEKKVQGNINGRREEVRCTTTITTTTNNNENNDNSNNNDNNSNNN